MALVLASLLVGTTTARAEPSSDPEPSRPSVVQIVATGAPGTTSALEQLVRELVSELPIELEWSVSRAIDPRQVLARRTGDRSALVRAWVDLSDQTRAKIYVANGESERFIVRFVPEPNGYDAVAREALGQILESSIAAFVAHADAGISHEDAVREVAQENSELLVEDPRERPPAPPPPSPPAPGPGPRFDVGLAYQGAVLDSGPIVLQHGVAVISGAAFDVGGVGGPLRLAVRGSVGYRAPAQWDGQSIALRLSGATARLAVGIVADATRRLSLGVVLGGGLDVVSVDPLSRTEGTQAHPSTQNVEPFLSLMATARLRLAGPLGLFLGLGTDFDLSHPRYGVEGMEGADGLTPVFTPWVVRPTAVLGLLAEFGGTQGP
jgi:hypothetical protein